MVFVRFFAFLVLYGLAAVSFFFLCPKGFATEKWQVVSCG